MWQRWAVGVMGLAFAPLVLAQTVVTREGAYTVFRTGTNELLVSVTNRIELPDLGVIPSLSFEFGFATAEPDLLDTFFDSFSLTLQRSNQTATVLSADRTGVAWGPRIPGGLELNPNAMLLASNAFPNLSPSLPIRFAFTVSVFLPAPLSVGPFDVFLDFFDNLNTAASMAYLIGMRLDATGSLDAKARFYRINSTIRTRIDSIREDGQSILMTYHFVPQLLELHSASTVSGPYTRATNAALRAAEQVFILSRPNTNQFFRVLSETPVRIVDIRVSDASLLVEFNFEPAFVEVESALTVKGPFFERPASRSEATRRKLRVAKPGLLLPPP